MARAGLVDARSLEVPRPRFRRRVRRPRGRSHDQPEEHISERATPPDSTDLGDPLATLRQAIDTVPDRGASADRTAPDDTGAQDGPDLAGSPGAGEAPTEAGEADLPPELLELAAESEDPVQIRPRRRGTFARRDDAGSAQPERTDPARRTEPAPPTEATAPNAPAEAEQTARAERPVGDESAAHAPHPDTADDQAEPRQEDPVDRPDAAGPALTVHPGGRIEEKPREHPPEEPGHQVAYSPLSEIPDPDSPATGARLGPAPTGRDSGLHPDVVAALSLPTTRGFISRLRRDSDEPTEAVRAEPAPAASEEPATDRSPDPESDAATAPAAKAETPQTPATDRSPHPRPEASTTTPQDTEHEPDDRDAGRVEPVAAAGSAAAMAPEEEEEEEPADEEPVPAFVEYRSSELPRTGLTVLFVAAVVGAVLAILLCVKAASVPSVLLAASLVLVSLASWWALLGWSPRIVAIGAGTLEVAHGPHSERFDLRDPGLDIRPGADPRSRGWTCEIHRAGAAPVVIGRGQVHPEEFCRIVHALRADAPTGS